MTADGDANDENATGCTVYYEDADADTFGTSTNLCLCTATTLYAATFTDCISQQALGDTNNDGLDDFRCYASWSGTDRWFLGEAL